MLSVKRLDRVCSILMVLSLSLFSTQLVAWGHTGHTTVGLLAIDRLPEDSRNQLQAVIGSLDEDMMSKACNWPDVVRETEEWAWSYPLHYINIPRGDFSYQKARDCPDGQCVTEAIKTYAAELGDPGNSIEHRWQAFAWICHLVGDLHQPLHAGFADDRGGNDIDVVYMNQKIDLHSLWDEEIIQQHANSPQELTQLVTTLSDPIPSEKMCPGLLDDWTNESHKLAMTQVYPLSPEISKDYEARSWQLMRQRINVAAARLALVIDSELGHD